MHTKSRKGNISESALLCKLALRQLPPKAQTTNKTNLLFVINFKYYNPFFSFFTRLTERLDYSRYDITLLLEGKYADQYATQLEALDPRVHLAVKRGKMLCDAETNRRLAYLKYEHHFMRNRPIYLLSYPMDFLFVSKGAYWETSLLIVFSI